MLILSVRQNTTDDIIELYINGTFYPVCYSGWQQSWSDNICVQMGFKYEAL